MEFSLRRETGSDRDHVRFGDAAFEENGRIFLPNSAV